MDQVCMHQGDMWRVLPTLQRKWCRLPSARTRGAYVVIMVYECASTRESGMSGPTGLTVHWIMLALQESRRLKVEDITAVDKLLLSQKQIRQKYMKKA